MGNKQLRTSLSGSYQKAFEIRNMVSDARENSAGRLAAERQVEESRQAYLRAQEAKKSSDLRKLAKLRQDAVVRVQRYLAAGRPSVLLAAQFRWDARLLGISNREAYSALDALLPNDNDFRGDVLRAFLGTTSREEAFAWAERLAAK